MFAQSDVLVVAGVGFVFLHGLIVALSGVRAIPNDRIGVVEKRWSARGSVRSGLIALARARRGGGARADAADAHRVGARDHRRDQPGKGGVPAVAKRTGIDPNVARTAAAAITPYVVRFIEERTQHKD